MDLFQDFEDLLAAFAAAKVEYVLIGGYAVIFHGRPRATKDLDLLVRVTDDNRLRLVEALRGFGVPANVLSAAASMQASEVVYFGVSPLRVDLLGSAEGVDFDTVASNAVETVVGGSPVKVIGIDDLIRNKIATGRPRDLEDAAELERIRAKR